MTIRRCTVPGLLLALTMGWGELTLAQDQPAPNRLLVMGDSLSAAHNIPLQSGWVSLLQDRLGDDWQVTNASISGETTAGGLTRLPGILAEHQPGWVFLGLGANDGLRALSTAAMADNLRKMIDISREAGAQVLLLGIQIPDNYGPIYQQRFAEVYPRIADGKDVPLVPFLLEGVGTEPELMQADGLHPTAEAQPMILETVLKHWQNTRAADAAGANQQ